METRSQGVELAEQGGAFPNGEFSAQIISLANGEPCFPVRVASFHAPKAQAVFRGYDLVSFQASGNKKRFHLIIKRYKEGVVPKVLLDTWFGSLSNWDEELAYLIDDPRFEKFQDALGALKEKCQCLYCKSSHFCSKPRVRLPSEGEIRVLDARIPLPKGEKVGIICSKPIAGAFYPDSHDHSKNRATGKGGHWEFFSDSKLSESVKEEILKELEIKFPILVPRQLDSELKLVGEARVMRYSEGGLIVSVVPARFLQHHHKI